MVRVNCNSACNYGVIIIRGYIHVCCMVFPVEMLACRRKGVLVASVRKSPDPVFSRKHVWLPHGTAMKGVANTKDIRVFSIACSVYIW